MGSRATRRGRLGLAAFVGLVALAMTASPASATVTIGETFPPTTNTGASDTTYLQSGSPGGQYAVPSTAGVTFWTLTSWSFHAPASGTDRLKFKVARPAGEDVFTMIGESSLVDPAPGVVNTFPAQIPVRAGDVIGLYWDTPNTGNFFRPAAGYEDHFVNSDVVPPTTMSFDPEGGAQFPVSATLEPSSTFTLGGIQRNKKKGTATLTLNLPNPGELIGSGGGAKVASVAAVSKAVPAGQAKLVIRAKGKKRAKLNDTGKVKVTPTITYTPTGGAPSAQSVKLKLKKK